MPPEKHQKSSGGALPDRWDCPRLLTYSRFNAWEALNKLSAKKGKEIKCTTRGIEKDLFFKAVLNGSCESTAGVSTK